MDRLDRLEQAVESITRAVGDLQARLAALEGARAENPGAAAPPPGPVDPAAAEIASAAPEPARGGLAAKLPHAGRTFLVLGGAFLLRALTDAGTLPPPAGVSLGLAYALAWIAFAHRDAAGHRPTSAAFHGLSSVLVAYPLLFEGAVRFDVLSPGGAALTLAIVTAIGLGSAWRGHVPFMAWLFTLAATATIVSLLFAMGQPILFTALLVALGAATLGLGYTRDWGGPRWLVAIAANLAVLRTALVAGHPDATGPSASDVQMLIVAFLLFYLGTFALWTLVRRRPVGAFEILQSAAVLLVGIGGAVHVTGAAGSGGGPIGISALTAGGLSYAAAFAFVRRRLGRGRNFFFYSSLALVLVLTGSRLIGLDGFCTITCGGLAMAAAFVGGRFDRVTLRAHSAVYAVAAAWQSGLLVIAAAAFTDPDPRAPSDALGAWLALTFVTVAYGMLVATRGFRKAPRLARIPRVVLALVSASGIAAVAVLLVVQAVPERAAGGAGSVATIRTVVLAVAAAGLALARRRHGIPELGWLAALCLAGGALKLVLEDLRAGAASGLFVAFAFYGAALILVPRLLRSPPPVDAGSREGG